MAAFAALVGVMTIATAVLAGEASGAVYWGNTSTIGRVNGDGSYRQDGGGAGAIFIGALGEQRIAGACGVAVDGLHIYWGDKFHGAIGRANLDGSEPNFAFIAGASEPCGVAADGSYLYWANEGASTIGRARLDGSEVLQDFIAVPKFSEPEFEVPKLCGVAVNGTHVFWANWREDLIGRATLDGKEVVPNFVETPEYGPCGVAVNASHLFWGSYGSDVGRANLDGSEPEFDFVAGLDRPCAVAVDGEHLYWISEMPRREIGRVNLDGSAATTVVSDLQSSCGLAVNALSFTPSLPASPSGMSAGLRTPPPPPQSPCKIERVRHNRKQEKLIVGVRGPARGRIEVLSRGVRSRMLSDEAPFTANSNPRLWWVAIWPDTEGRVAKRIGKRLARRGRARLGLRVRCSGNGQLSTTVTKKLALLATPAASVHRRNHSR
ncbi:MAG: hypothetical protein AB7V58_06665 [Solirubrobacterales bacterium]